MRLLASLGLASALTTGCLAGTGPEFGDGWPIHSVEVFGAVAFGGRTDTRNDSVHVVLILTNQGVDSARVEHGACSFAVLAEAPGGVTWDNRPPPNTFCIDIGLSVLLGPGESKERAVLQASIGSILADSLPAGLYRFSIFYRQRGGGLCGLEPGEAQLDAAG